MREMQIKTTVMYYFPPIRVAIISATHTPPQKKQKIISVGKDVEKFEPLLEGI